jgi:hypothetical protein
MYCDGKKRAPVGQARKYQVQYDNARYHARHVRGIEWQFTYESWVAWWGDDIDRRGPNSGQLVMSRHGDTGPYHPDNVSKKTCNENCGEGSRGPNSARARIQAQKLQQKEPA